MARFSGPGFRWLNGNNRQFNSVRPQRSQAFGKFRGLLLRSCNYDSLSEQR